MRVVLYTLDLEPITVLSLDLQGRLLKPLIEGPGYFVLAVIEPLSVGPCPFPPEPKPIPMRTVEIKVEWLHRNGRRVPMFLTADEESALLLQSTFLPGQQAEARRLIERGIEEGVWRALRDL